MLLREKKYREFKSSNSQNLNGYDFDLFTNNRTKTLIANKGIVKEVATPP